MARQEELSNSVSLVQPAPAGDAETASPWCSPCGQIRPNAAVASVAEAAAQSHSGDHRSAVVLSYGNSFTTTVSTWDIVREP